MKHNALQMSLLLDYYGELLTEKQRTYFDLYYNQDLSLGEIAEEFGISRQGVHDFLTKAEVSLVHMEQTLGCVAREQKLQKLLDTICSAAEELGDVPQKARILDAARELKE